MRFYVFFIYTIDLPREMYILFFFFLIMFYYTTRWSIKSLNVLYYRYIFESSQNVKTEIRFHNAISLYLLISLSRYLLFHSRPFPCIFSVFISNASLPAPCMSELPYISQTSPIPLPICEGHPNRRCYQSPLAFIHLQTLDLTKP